MGNYTHGIFNSWAELFARWVAAETGRSILGLVHAFGGSTDPDFSYIGPVYDRVLAVSLLLIGALVAAALAERALGGKGGVGLGVIPRVLAACFAAFAGLPLMQQASHYAGLLGSMWNPDFLDQTRGLLTQVASAYSSPGVLSNHVGTGTMILAGVLTMLLSLVVYVELVLRAALILVTTAFLPLVSVMLVWPRLKGVATHLMQFLAVLLLSKFVVATASYVGFSMAVHGTLQPGSTSDQASAAISGLATLALAAFAPLILFQGIRFAEVGSATLVRGWVASSATYLNRGARASGALFGRGWRQGKGLRGSTRPRKTTAPKAKTNG